MSLATALFVRGAIPEIHSHSGRSCFCFAQVYMFAYEWRGPHRIVLPTEQYPIWSLTGITELPPETSGSGTPVLPGIPAAE
jgi:hypothetical protein